MNKPLQHGDMALSSWRTLLVWLLKATLIVWAFNALLLAVLSMSGYTFANLIISGFLSKMLLLETGVAFLIGGAMAFSGSVLPSKAKEHLLKSEEKWSIEKLKKNEKTANKYIVLAVFLFVNSLIISILGF